MALHIPIVVRVHGAAMSGVLDVEMVTEDIDVSMFDDSTEEHTVRTSRVDITRRAGEEPTTDGTPGYRGGFRMRDGSFVEEWFDHVVVERLGIVHTLAAGHLTASPADLPPYAFRVQETPLRTVDVVRDLDRAIARIVNDTPPMSSSSSTSSSSSSKKTTALAGWTVGPWGRCLHCGLPARGRPPRARHIAHLLCHAVGGRR